MSRAEIYIEDADGAIAVKAVFGSGFNKTSHAHQHAQILLNMLDQLCQRQGEPEVVAAEEAPKLVLAAP